MINLNEVISKLSEFGGTIKVRNAMNPLLWLCSLIIFANLVLLFFWISIQDFGS